MTTTALTPISAALFGLAFGLVAGFLIAAVGWLMIIGGGI